MKLLIVKLSALGDLLQALSLLGSFRKKYPKDQITFCTDPKFAPLLEGVSAIDRVITFDIRKDSLLAFWKKIRREHYDKVFDLQGNIKSMIPTLFARADIKRGFSFRSAPEWIASLPLDLQITPSSTSERERLAELLGIEPKLTPLDFGCKEVEAFDKPFILIAPFSRWKSKEIEDATWHELLAAFKDYHFVICCGSERERLRAASFKEGATLLYQKSLPELQRFMQKALLVVGVDSALLHLATLSGVKALALFGPSNPNCYHPGSSLFGDCVFGYRFQKRCKTLRQCHGFCTKSLSKKQIMEAMQEAVLDQALSPQGS